ncbi:hypothetical protein GCM10023189_29460 [Nibrella saemangeumensis]|uniref:HTH cro/C1-type domain-containing protein n=1 Tax=Nibrella saemangeumensis TaxID=1084526 RepID=A0ABP8N0T9_9BACT
MKTKTTHRLPGERIRLLRLQRGYSQENMADLLNLSTTAYGDIERGKTELTLSRLEQIADVLNLSVTELLTEEAITAQPVEVLDNETRHELETLRLRLEKQQIELDKLRLDAEHWKRKYEERVMLDLVRAIGTDVELPRERERIGFK